jgi:VWFA-related protein
MSLILAAALALAFADPPPKAVPASPTAAIDIIVRDAENRAVERLTAEDLMISEDGVPLTIESVRFVRATGQGSEMAAISGRDAISAGDGGQSGIPEGARIVAIYLDEFHVSPGASADRVRGALTAFLATLGPADVVVVMRPLDSILNITIAGDRETARRAIQAFTPRQGDYVARTAFERNFIAGDPARIDAARAQITASSLHALVRALGSAAPTRKTLILVSDGFAPRGRRLAGVLPGMSAVAAAANRAHVSIYPIVVDTPVADSASESSDRARENRDAVQALARETAGRSIAGSAIDTGLRQALDDASGYYLVTFVRPTAAGGGFHGVDISTRRADLTTFSRKTYWTPSVREQQAALALARTVDRPAPIRRRASPLIRPWFGMSRGEGGATRIDFAWEPSPASPGAREPGPSPARVAISVTDADGTPVFEGTVLPSTNTGLAGSSTTPSRVSFESDAGRLLVQMSIEDASTRVVDHDVRDLVVDRFTDPIVMGTAEVLRARTMLERNRLASEPEAAPVTARQFSRDERLLIRVPVSGDAGTPIVSGRLVSDFGSVLRELVATPMDARPGVYQLDVPLVALASGGYAIELKAAGSDGEATERVAFRIVP